jgi:hypothetical protein
MGPQSTNDHHSLTGKGPGPPGMRAGPDTTPDPPRKHSTLADEASHTVAQPYQVMPPLAEAEYEALKASIAAGYDPAHPVVTDENGIVLDGHHRRQVCAELGITPPVVILPGLTEDQKHDYAVRANLACRHLTQLQKRELIAAELERDPSRSDREIGRLCGADHKTVGAVRRGEIPHPDPRPLTREEAEEISEGIGDSLRRMDDYFLDSVVCHKISPALIAAVLRRTRAKIHEKQRTEHTLPGDVFAAADEAFFCSRIDFFAGMYTVWPCNWKLDDAEGAAWLAEWAEARPGQHQAELERWHEAGAPVAGR